MSTMTQIEVLAGPRRISLVPAKPMRMKPTDQSEERHPLVLIFVAGFIAFNLSIGFIGSILIWLALRNSGVMAP